jgi:hypothetical protein
MVRRLSPFSCSLIVASPSSRWKFLHFQAAACGEANAGVDEKLEDSAVAVLDDRFIGRKLPGHG